MFLAVTLGVSPGGTGFGHLRLVDLRTKVGPDAPGYWWVRSKKIPAPGNSEIVTKDVSIFDAFWSIF
jgi:hypothetical protein